MRNEMFRCLRCRYLYVVHDEQTPQVCDVCHGERFVRVLIGQPVTALANAAPVAVAIATDSLAAAS